MTETRYREASRAALWRVDKTCPLRYPAGVLREGEVRYTTPNMTLPTRNTLRQAQGNAFTGQYSYISDDATDLGSSGFGLMFYQSRWYDPTSGRFSQADTIVPGGVQGLDRYAAMNNNPVKYSDPSGHDPWYCETAECEAKYDPFLAKLNHIQDTYGVIIDNSNGLWTLKFLEAIEKGMSTLQSAMGKDTFEEIFSGTTFEVGTQCDVENQMCAGGNRITLGTSVSQSHSTYIEHSTVHELAHVWNNSCNRCMSEGFLRETGGNYDANGAYQPGGIPPTTHATLNESEDFAESITKYLYPKYPGNPLDSERTVYVSSALASPLTNPLFFHIGGGRLGGR